VRTAVVEAVLASRNQGKAAELTRLLRPVVAVVPLPTEVALPPETGATLLENACLKAEAAFAALGGRSAVLADDSGLEVDALHGRPGVLSARFAGETASDQDNLQHLLAALQGQAQRTARFVCELVMLLPLKDGGPCSLRARGTLEGTIIAEPRGEHGFGYDPIFVPVGWDHSIAEGRAEEKDAVSHRAAAARSLREQLAAAGS